MRRLNLLAQRVLPGSVSALYCVFSAAVAVLLALTPASASAQQAVFASTLSGTVYDAQGSPAIGVTVRLQARDQADILTRADAHGHYNFAALKEGVYALHAEMSAEKESTVFSATVASILLGRAESRKIDLTLEAGEPLTSQLHASSTSAAAPQFFDQPTFNVSGVTDTTSLGGHGSDTVVRTREALAKETASLAKNPVVAPAIDEATSEAALREKVEEHPRDFAANHDLGERLLRRGNAGEAITYFDRATALNPADYDNAYQAALANQDAGNYERALVSAQALLAVHDNAHDKAELHHLLADVQEKLGHSLEAVREYQRAAAFNPSEPYIFDWGSELLLHHAPEPAFEVFSRGNHLFPRSVRMLIGSGATWFARGSYDQAVEQICAASDLDPHDPAPYLFLGLIETAQKESAQTLPSEAVIGKLRQFAVLELEDAKANYYYAVALWRRRQSSAYAGSAAKVEPLLNKAIHLDPKFSDAYLQLGILHSEQKHFSQAISEYQNALACDRQTPADTRAEAHYRLAQAYRQTGEADKAKAESLLYDQAVKESAQQTEQERHEIRQFVYTLRDQPPSQKQ